MRFQVFPSSYRRIAMWVLALLLMLFLLWLAIAQPSLAHSAPSTATVSAERLRKHVEMLSETFHPRSFAQVTNLDRCAEYIASEFRAAGARTEMQEFIVLKGTYRNVIGSFGPESGERLVVGAHYDGCYSTPGADDNASGVAGLIELAGLLGKTDLPITVELVAYALEEPPFYRTPQMGSFQHAARLKKQNIAVRAMIVLEMIGSFSDEPRSQSYPILLLHLYYPSRANFVAVVGNLGQFSLTRRVKGLMRGTTDLPVHSINAPSAVPGIDFSDHLNYWKHGYPAVMITDTAFCRNPRYHGPDDTADTLDYERMGKTVIAMYEAVRSLAER